MKTILVASDFSKGAGVALEYAAHLARDLQAKLVLYHAYNLATPTAGDPISTPNVSALLRQNHARLSAIAATVAQNFGLIAVAETSSDLFFKGLDKQVLKHQVDLVVMGMRGKSGIGKMFGSFTAEAIKRAQYPLLVVPEDARFVGIQKILFACDFNYFSSSSELSSLLQIAKAYVAEIDILHVEQTDDILPKDRKQILKKIPNLEKLLRGIDHTYRFIHQDKIFEAIRRGVYEMKADMVVMVPHRKGLWDSLMHPSITRKMAQHSHVPLLALPDADMSQHGLSPGAAVPVREVMKEPSWYKNLSS